MKRIVDMAGYQTVWFAAVIGAGRGAWWAGPLAAALFALWHVVAAPSRAIVLRLMLAGLVIGLLVDGSLVRGGWIDFAARGPEALRMLAAPPWILALWMVFPLTLTCSLALLQHRLALATLLGAIGAPLAYAGAARGWSVWTSELPHWQVLAAIGVGWAIALPLLARIARSAPTASPRWVAA